MHTSPAHRSRPIPGRPGLGSGLLAASALVLILALSPSAQAAPTLGAHASNPTETLSKAEAKSIFSGKQLRWSHGKTIVLVLPPKGSAEMKWLTGHILGIPEEVYRRYLMQRVFRGKMKAPIEAGSVEETKIALARNRGAVAPIPASAVGGDIKNITVP